MKSVFKKFRIDVKCKKCGNNSFVFWKERQAMDEHSLRISETMCHHGVGFMLDSFHSECSVCGCENMDFPITEYLMRKRY